MTALAIERYAANVKVGEEMPCKICSVSVTKRHSMQFYCHECSERVHLEKQKMTKSRWARENPRSEEQERKQRTRRTEMAKSNGLAISRSAQANLMEAGPPRVDLIWAARIKVPYSQAASKNFIFGQSGIGGHRYKRQQSKEFQKQIAWSLRAALKGTKVARNKIWLGIFVQKPTHKSDAVNVIDLICDAVTDATGIDDRWVSIHYLDWQISKTDPAIFIQIGQESDVDLQVCSRCGRGLPFENFAKNRTNKLGITRECRDCRTVGKCP